MRQSGEERGHRGRSAARLRALGYTISAICIVLLARAIDLTEVGRVLRAVDLPRLGFALLVIVVDRLLMVGKWYALLAVRLPGVSAIEALRAYLVAWSVRLLIPIAAVPDVVRAIIVGRPRSRVSEVGASIVIERLLGMIASGLLVLGALASASRTRLPSSAAVGIWVAGGLAITLLALLVPLHGSVRSRMAKWSGARVHWRGMPMLRRAGAAFAEYRAPRLLLAVGALSVLEQMLRILVWWALARAVNVQIGLGPLLVAMPLSWVVTRLPISISGIGVLEGVLVGLLGLYGVPAHQVLAVAVLHRGYELLLALPGAVVWVGSVRHDRQVRAALRHDATLDVNDRVIVRGSAAAGHFESVPGRVASAVTAHAKTVSRMARRALSPAE